MKRRKIPMEIALASFVLVIVFSCFMGTTSGTLNQVFGCAALASGSCFTFAAAKIISLMEQGEI